MLDQEGKASSGNLSPIPLKLMVAIMEMMTTFVFSQTELHTVGNINTLMSF